MVDLFGCGRVGGALLPMLERSGIRVASVHDSNGARVLRAGARSASVLIDVTSPRYVGGAAEAWIRHLEEALGDGVAIVTCNKAPLALAWDRLIAAAASGRTTISCTATVGGGTPILPLLRRIQRTHGVRRLEASLNATLDYVCRRIIEGVALEDAIQSAQLAGWAEPDPTLDLNGTDLAAKSVIVHNLVFPSHPSQTLDPGHPPLLVEAEEIRRQARGGVVVRATSTIVPGRSTVRLSATLERQGHSAGGEASVRAELLDGTSVLLTGPGAGPEATARAVLGDILSLGIPPELEPVEVRT
ncbi:MAG TPA: hypothetical protein VFF67_08485 [Thermoplasmata archaeon]|nr:hypothetical protein [Thermoplasmata archaeon]